MAYYISRSGAQTQAVNTYTALPGLAGDGSGAITVPQGVSSIKQLIASISESIVAVASSGGNVLLRLTGNGLRDGQQDLTIGIIREDTTSTGGSKHGPPTVLDTDIAVVPGNQITPSVAYTGVDVGTPEVAVTLVFA